MHVVQVVASKSPSLLEFHLDLGSLEATSKVYIFHGIEFNQYDPKKNLFDLEPCFLCRYN